MIASTLLQLNSNSWSEYYFWGSIKVINNYEKYIAGTLWNMGIRVLEGIFSNSEKITAGTWSYSTFEAEIIVKLLARADVMG